MKHIEEHIAEGKSRNSLVRIDPNSSATRKTAGQRTENNVVSASMASEVVDRASPEIEVISYYSTKPTLHFVVVQRAEHEQFLKDSLIWQDGIGWLSGESVPHKSYKNAT